MLSLNMKSSATKIKGQGVGSAYMEQLKMMEDHLSGEFEIRINDKGKSDITHYHTIDIPHYLRLLNGRKETVSVGSVHFLPETVEQSLRMPKFCKKAFYKYLLSFYKKMDYLVVVNPYFIGRLANYGVEKDRIQYIPNYVSEENFYPMDAGEKRKLREKYGIAPDKFVVLGAGQLQTRKGIFDFAETAKRLPDVQFIWAGGFSFKKMTDGYKEITKLLENPPENIRFLGIVDREDMNGLYNIAQVMFLPSFEELFPMTVLESMNCRVPILLRDLDIYPDVLFDYYLKADGVDGFVQEIEKLRQDEVYWQVASDSAGRGHDFYSLGHVMSIWRQFYKKCMKNTSELEKDD